MNDTVQLRQLQCPSCTKKYRNGITHEAPQFFATLVARGIWMCVRALTYYTTITESLPETEQIGYWIVFRET